VVQNKKRRLSSKASRQSAESSTPTGVVRKKLLKSQQRPCKPASHRDRSNKTNVKSRDGEMDTSVTETSSTVNDNKNRTTPTSAATVSSATKLKLAAFSADVVVSCIRLSVVLCISCGTALQFIWDKTDVNFEQFKELLKLKVLLIYRSTL